MATFEQIELQSKPGVKLTYRFEDGHNASSKPTLIVFVNGLGMPQESWNTVIQQLHSDRGKDKCPPLLTYDRFGQGQTVDRDPQDQHAQDPSHGHDCLSAVDDMRQLITQVTKDKMQVDDVNAVALVLVCNSIGAAISRLYAQTFPHTVAAILFLDSVLANSDFVSIFPDPDEASFDAKSLPAGITPESLREAREGVRRVFHPDVGNKEGLSRKNLRDLLPHSDKPQLEGPDSRGTWITVLGHEFEAFAEESARMGRPKLLTMEYANPYWQTYNEGLAKLTEPERSQGPIQAPGAGHFIQKDNPDIVNRELSRLLDCIQR